MEQGGYDVREARISKTQFVGQPISIVTESEEVNVEGRGQKPCQGIGDSSGQ